MEIKVCDLYRIIRQRVSIMRVHGEEHREHKELKERRRVQYESSRKICWKTKTSIVKSIIHPTHKKNKTFIHIIIIK